MTPVLPRGARRALLLALVAVLSGCAGLREALAPAPRGEPSGRPGWLVYTVGGLRFEAPEAWRASGGPRHLKLEAPDGGARLEVSTPDQPFATAQACLADAEVVLRRGEGMERTRKHATTFAGVRAHTLEGDAAGWHVWAWAACDGGSQYRIFLTARTPAPAEVVEAYRALTSSARIGGQA
jgi:hypothetical protein